MAIRMYYLVRYYDVGVLHSFYADQSADVEEICGGGRRLMVDQLLTNFEMQVLATAFLEGLIEAVVSEDEIKELKLRADAAYNQEELAATGVHRRLAVTVELVKPSAKRLVCLG